LTALLAEIAEVHRAIGPQARSMQLITASDLPALADCEGFPNSVVVY
jgi:hypothetical protein